MKIDSDDYWKIDLLTLTTGMLMGTAGGAAAVRVFEVNGHLEIQSYTTAAFWVGLALHFFRQWLNRRS